MTKPDRVELVEVGPRDGLQNEATPIPVSDKIKLVDLLSDAGFRRIETGSFVSARWVPQMADSDQVFAGITRHTGTRYAALTPNVQGYDAAMQAGADEVAVFASASEGFSRANLNASIAESLDRFAPIFERARDDDVPVRGYVSCVIACPYDGPTRPTQVADVTEKLCDMGCYEISLGDTIGAGTPTTMAAMLDVVCSKRPPSILAGHFHDTGGRALPNIDAALKYGLRVFDTSIAGLGGCPYAPGAPGNVSTEAVHRHLVTQGYVTGLDEAALAKAEAHATAVKTAAAGA